jgi:uncharacterized protein
MATCYINPHSAPPEPGSNNGANLPCYYKFQTKKGFYIYDFNSNNIVKISKEIYDHLDLCMNGKGNGNEGEISISMNDETVAAVQKAVKDMQEQGLLRRTENEVVSPPYCDECISEKFVADIQMMCLELSQQCNLRCRYCAYSGNYPEMRKHNPRLMSTDVAFKAIAYYLEHSHKIENPVISFYGGEPLLNKETMFKCVEYARAHAAARSTLRFSVDTNGTLVDDRLLDYFMENDFIVQISLDGPKHVHDRNRVFKNGRGSWERINTLLEKVFQRDPIFFEQNLFIACTMAPPYPIWDLDKYFRGEKEQRLNMMVNFVDEEGIDLASIYPEEFAKGNVWQDMYDYHIDYLTKMCTGKRDELSVVARAIYDRPIVDILSKRKETFDGRVPCNGICVPGVRKMFVDVHGNYYPCERVGQDFIIGHADSGFDRESIDHLIEDYRVLCEKHCHRCWAARLCRLCFATVRRNGRLSEERKLEECNYERGNLSLALFTVAQILEACPESMEWVKHVTIT